MFPQNFLIESQSNPNMTKIWQFQYTRIDRYFLGGYGSMRTDGMDLIRLTDVNGLAINNFLGYGSISGPPPYYEPHPNYSRTESTNIQFSGPEIFGGGERDTMPYYPYLDPASGDWLYGAPDGFRDGVIIALTSGTDSAGNF